MTPVEIYDEKENEALQSFLRPKLLHVAYFWIGITGKLG
jgi:hypothetical protein